jgi:hypothetical protein
MNGNNTLQVYYLNNVGVLNVIINHDQLKSEYISLSHKCEDGNLSIKLTFKSIQYNFNVFLTKSMSARLKDTKGIISDYSAKLKYHVTKDLFVNKIFEYPMLSIRDCLDFETIEDISCLKCNKVVLNNIPYNKIVSNFNYDYIDNLEILSCHEDDINNIIPDIDEKLKKL